MRPELSNKTLSRGSVNQFYSEVIHAEIKNEPQDNAYDYFFDVRGNIPDGVEVIYEYRKVFIEGVPTRSGRYTFTVYLDVDAPNGYYYDEYGNERYDDALCSDSTSEAYTIVVR